MCPSPVMAELWIQLPTVLKGQGPPATQSICQAADYSPATEKRETQAPELNTEDKKMHYYVGCCDPEVL